MRDDFVHFRHVAVKVSLFQQQFSQVEARRHRLRIQFDLFSIAGFGPDQVALFVGHQSQVEMDQGELGVVPADDIQDPFGVGVLFQINIASRQALLVLGQLGLDLGRFSQTAAGP